MPCMRTDVVEDDSKYCHMGISATDIVPVYMDNTLKSSTRKEATNRIRIAWPF